MAEIVMLEGRPDDNYQLRVQFSTAAIATVDVANGSSGHALVTLVTGQKLHVPQRDLKDAGFKI